MARVVLAMSGGVDSSVAAWLLKREGHDVVGLFMRHGVGAETTCSTDIGQCNASGGADQTRAALQAEHDRSASGGAVASSQSASTLPVVALDQPSHKKGCCTAADAIDARRVADRLDIPFYVLNFDDAFADIIDYFVEEYTSGRTPNPCIVCNNWLKFGRLWQYAQSIGAEQIATGHYARLIRENEDRLAIPRLCRGRDAEKDQSYVLFGIERSLLGRLAFPVGEYDKQQIRSIASRLGLPVAEKKDSQEICFIPDGDYAAFVGRRISGDRAGTIVTTDGRVVGRHQGVEHFTIGQRRGLGVALGEPYYVVRIDREKRQVVIGRREELGTRELTADRANWLVEPPTMPFRCEAQIRYRSRPAAATVEPLDERRFRVRFDQPQFGVAPGQAVVCYAGPRVLGGGWIC